MTPVKGRDKAALMHEVNPLWTPRSIGMTYITRFQEAIKAGVYLNVYVPNPTSPNVLSLSPRTAIVGQIDDAGNVVIYFEGWIHGAFQYENLDARQKWVAGVRHAGERMLTHYPTVARGILHPTELEHIGIYDPADRTAEGVWVAPDRGLLLQAWLTEDVTEVTT